MCNTAKRKYQCVNEECQYAHTKEELGKIVEFWKSQEEEAEQKKIALQKKEAEMQQNSNDSQNKTGYTLPLGNLEIQLVKGELFRENSDVIVNLNDDHLTCSNITSRKLIEANRYVIQQSCHKFMFERNQKAL